MKHAATVMGAFGPLERATERGDSERRLPTAGGAPSPEEHVHGARKRFAAQEEEALLPVAGHEGADLAQVGGGGRGVGEHLGQPREGLAVDLDEAERWFKPFESTTVQTDPVLGQGMGMGLIATLENRL